MSHDVFISYSVRDQRTANAICKSLEAQGIKCWIASRDIPSGDLYPGAIVEAIDASRIFILVFSSNSNSSNDVFHEVERAFQKELIIIPFKVENVKPSTNLEYFLSVPQWHNALDRPLAFHLEKLADTVGAILKRPRKTKRKLISYVSPMQLKVVVGIGLALAIGTLLFFTSFKPVSDEKQFNDAVEKLSSASSQEQLDGLRALDQLAASGDEYWYWHVMDQLTNYVRQHARRTGGDDGDQPPKERPPTIEAVLKVIGARPAVYPAHFSVPDKEKKRRDLRGTDLRGLRLMDKAHLEYVDLQGSTLEGIVMREANLEGAMLKAAILKNADLGTTILKGADLGGADIYNANLKSTNGLDVNFLMLAENWECANLSDVLWNQIREELGEEISKDRCR